MALSFHAVRTTAKAADAVIGIITSDAVSSGDTPADAGQLSNAGFEGKDQQIHAWPADGRVAALVGIGSVAEVDLGSIRRAAALMARSFGRHRRVVVELPTDTDLEFDAMRQVLAEGVVLGAYRYSSYKSDTEAPKLCRVDVLGGSGAKARAALDLGVVIAGAQTLARDLVNEPGGSLTAPVFARRAASIARKSGVKVKVWDEAAIKKGRLGGLLGVNRGSTNPPRFVEFTYEPAGRAIGTLAFVGKGITFDAGGLSIKTGQGMMTMKCDMAGAAAVVGALSALAAVKARCRVRGFVPMTDNMPGGDATRPGDVVAIRNGKTIEVLNTDAEGRLVLADALSVASEAKPDAIVDLATLTGACMVALGPKIAGLMGNNDSWLCQVEASGDTTGERVWRLPLPDDYKTMFESSLADMKNIGGPHGGAITAGLLLQEFVADGIPWAHIDIAGPAFTDSDDADITKGGTGFGVRLLIDLARNFEPPG